MRPVLIFRWVAAVCGGEDRCGCDSCCGGPLLEQLLRLSSSSLPLEQDALDISSVDEQSFLYLLVAAAARVLRQVLLEVPERVEGVPFPSALLSDDGDVKTTAGGDSSSCWDELMVAGNTDLT